jgi:hypothetical protein
VDLILLTEESAGAAKGLGIANVFDIAMLRI